MIALPSTWPILGAVVAAAFAAGVAGGWTANGWRLEAKLQSLQAEHASLVAKAEREAREAEAAEREKESRWNAAQQETARVASLARARDEDDRRAADDSGRRLLNAARAAAGRACEASAGAPVAGASAPAGEPVRALVDVLIEARGAAGEMAAAADAARTAGLACVSSYEALTQRREPAPNTE